MSHERASALGILALSSSGDGSARAVAAASNRSMHPASVRPVRAKSRAPMSLPNGDRAPPLATWTTPLERVPRPPEASLAGATAALDPILASPPVSARSQRGAAAAPHQL